MGKGKGTGAGSVRARAASEVQRAGRLLADGRFAEALPILRGVSLVLGLGSIEAGIGDCLQALGRADEAVETYRRGFRAHPKSAELALRLARHSLGEGDFAAALPAFRVAQPAHRDDPAVLGAHAYAALQAGAFAEAEAQAQAAHALAPSDDAALVLGLARAGQGRFAEAAATLEAVASDRARATAARFHAAAGQLERALEIYVALDTAGGMGPHDWAPAAQVAALSGQPARGASWVARAQAHDPGPATQIAIAELSLSSGQPARALEALEGLADAPEPDDRALAQALTARAHRIAEQVPEARAALDRIPADSPPRALGMACADRGHLHALDGDFEAAEAAFAEALALDPQDADAQRGLALARQKLSWKRGVEATAEKQVEAARAEAEAVRRAVADRDHQLARLQRQLAQLERERKAAEQKARAAQAEIDAARLRAEGERKKGLQAELAAREGEVRARVDEALAQAYGGRLSAVSPPLLNALRVAEQSYQTALQTDLPGAGVAVLYAGVLERALYTCIVSELDASLDEARRARLLQASLRGERNGRPEYADTFVAAFDRLFPMRAPGLGEVSRVIRKRRAPHLEIVRGFLEDERGYPPAFLDALAAFVDASKAKLRDPIAHGRLLEVTDAEIAAFRRALVQSFEGGPGVLFRLSFPRG